MHPKASLIIAIFTMFILNSCCTFSSSWYCERKKLYESSALCHRAETVCDQAREMRRQYRKAGTPKDDHLINLEIECAHSYKGCQEFLDDEFSSQDCCSDGNYQ